LLAGDIGGTKTTLAIFELGNDLGAPLAEATFPSHHYPSLEAVAQTFLSQTHLTVERASFGVAGPVMEGRAEGTNIPWLMDENIIRQVLGIPTVKLLNDLNAIAQAVPHLPPADLHVINTGRPVEHGPIAVVAPGTGLGEAFLVWDGNRYQSYPSEGSHVNFGPADKQQRDLLAYLQEKMVHISVERVCSGIGIPNLYAFLRDSGAAEEPDWLAAELELAADPTPIIAQAAADSSRRCPLCEETMNLFVSILASEAGNLALKILATGGVYLGGGIPPRILPALRPEPFMASFSAKGRMDDLLHVMPVHVILNSRAALLGAAYYGLEEYNQER
jgi:glucokinase